MKGWRWNGSLHQRCKGSLKIWKATVFSTRNMFASYSHVELAEHVKDMNTLNGRKDAFQLFEIAIGLGNASEMFQRIEIELILGPGLDNQCIDDVEIHSLSMLVRTLQVNVICECVWRAVAKWNCRNTLLPKKNRENLDMFYLQKVLRSSLLQLRKWHSQKDSYGPS